MMNAPGSRHDSWQNYSGVSASGSERVPPYTSSAVSENYVPPFVTTTPK